MNRALAVAPTSQQKARMCLGEQTGGAGEQQERKKKELFGGKCQGFRRWRAGEDRRHQERERCLLLFKKKTN